MQQSTHLGDISAFTSVHLKRGLKTAELCCMKPSMSQRKHNVTITQKLVRNNQPPLLSLLAQHT